MIGIRTVLAKNIKAYRKEKGLSQMKLADLVGIAHNYLVMIETEKRFPSDKMIDKLAVALDKEPIELFSISPVQKQWEIDILGEISSLINVKLQKAQEISSN
jgi:transcriptional regulator with XRE-family HTH domain